MTEPRKLSFFEDPAVRLLLVTGLVLILALGFVSYRAIEVNRGHLLPQMAAKADVVAETVRTKLDRALELGIPLGEMRGIPEFFAAIKADDPDVGFLVILDGSESVAFAEGIAPSDAISLIASPTRPLPNRDADPAAGAAAQYFQGDALVTIKPLFADGVQVGRIVLGHTEDALMRPLIDNLADIAVILLVMLFLSFELMVLVLSLSLSRPMKIATRVLEALRVQRFQIRAELHSRRGELSRFLARLNEAAGRLSGADDKPETVTESKLIAVRILAFMFVFAEELARPFMPVYFRDYASAVPGLDPQFGIGIVMTVQMAVIAIVMPTATTFYRQIGKKRLYIIGAGLALIGLFGTGLAVTYWDLIAWRAVSAVGYALSFVACQGFVLESTGQDNRAQGTSLMVSGIALADICGPAVGGVLADRIGQSETFMLGGGVALVSAFLVLRLFDSAAANAREAPPPASRSTLFEMLRQPQLFAVLVLAAFPAKMILTGFLFLLVPLALTDLGASEAEIGRVAMIYGLCAMLLGPIFARYVDRFGKPELALVIGGLLAAMGLLPLSAEPSFQMFVLAVVALGFGQAMSISAQVAVVLKMGDRVAARYGEGPVIGAMRLIERIGGGIGPILASTLAVYLTVPGAAAALGLYGAVSACLLALILLMSGAGRRRSGDMVESGS